MNTVLIVDDALFMRRLLMNIINEFNDKYIVVGEASDGLEAIKMARDKVPDIITLDVTMQNMDGLKALPEILRASPGSKIIMCSAMGQEPMIKESIKKGASDFIIKPFKKELVLSVLNKLTGGDK